MAISTIAAADGTPIAYQSSGSGPALVFVNGLASSTFYWRHLLERFDDRAQLVTWDLKGHGLSGAARDVSATTIPAAVDDLRRVMDAAGVERGVLVAFSLGCQIALEAWRQIPDRVAAIVPILGTYGRPFDHLVDSRVGPAAYHLIADLPETLATGAVGLGLKLGALSLDVPGVLGLGQRLGFIGARLSARDMRPFFAHLRMIHAPTWRAIGMAAQAHSAGDLLETIAVPTLVVAGGKDRFTPVHLSEEMARRIPDAEYFYVADCTHTGLLERGPEIATRLERFLVDRGVLPQRR